MKQTFLYIILLAITFLLDGCVPKVCPAYISSFYQKDDPNSLYYVKSTPDTLEDFFYGLGDTTYTVKGKVSYISYYTDDDSVEVKEEELFASRDKDWTGLLEQRGGLYGKLTNKDRRLANSNYPNNIIGLQHNPYPEILDAEDSVVDFIPEDSIYLVSSSDSLENMLFGGGPGYDDSKVAKDLPKQEEDEEVDNTSDSLPPMMYDGYVYMQRYSERVAKEDSMRAGFFIVPDSMYLVKRKWYEIWKPKHYLIPKRVLDEKDAIKMSKYEADSLAKLPQYDSAGNLIVEEKKGLFGKKKKEEETVEEGAEETSGEMDEIPADDDEPEEQPKDKPKKKKKKKKKDTEDKPAEDDEDW